MPICWCLPVRFPCYNSIWQGGISSLMFSTLYVNELNLLLNNPKTDGCVEFILLDHFIYLCWWHSPGGVFFSGFVKAPQLSLCHTTKVKSPPLSTQWSTELGAFECSHETNPSFRQNITIIMLFLLLKWHMHHQVCEFILQNCKS